MKFVIILRIFSFFVLFFSIVFLPWPIVAGLAAILISFFPWFWEAVIIGLSLGFLYGLPQGNSRFLFVFFVLIFPISLFIEEYLKKSIQKRNILSRFFIALAGGASITLSWAIFKLIIYV